MARNGLAGMVRFHFSGLAVRAVGAAWLEILHTFLFLTE
jgi:hypothetical protein